MNEPLQNLIEALREELKHYGEMLALLDQQQQWVALRQGRELLKSVTEVDDQAEAIRVARHEREQRFRDLARTLMLGKVDGFQQLIPSLPSECRPLVQALVEENNQLLQRIQKRARQNYLLLSRSLELMQRFINTLIPGSCPTTHSELGLVPASALPAKGFNEGIG